MDNREAVALVGLIGERVRNYKIGMELFIRYGPGLVREIRKMKRSVFLDVKYHDIPATVERATGAACDLGVEFLTVHTAGGGEMLRAAVKGRAGSSTKLLGVTVLTSTNGDRTEDTVLERARASLEEGLDGVVASAIEAASIRDLCGRDFLIVTPGIRPIGSSSDDQARIATPAEACRAGSDYLVVGRPVTRSEDPVRAVDDLIAEIHHAGE